LAVEPPRSSDGLPNPERFGIISEAEKQNLGSGFSNSLASDRSSATDIPGHVVHLNADADVIVVTHAPGRAWRAHGEMDSEEAH